jgi:protocatechuate 3,4-dioxygenase beta subunit
MNPNRSQTRRRFLGKIALGAAAFTTPGLFAEELMRTARDAEGPFYPDKLPLDTDNDLIVINDGVTPAVGKITHLSGRILDASGSPLRNAVVEIWQADATGVYLHSGSDGKGREDTNFQGFGRFLTSSKGQYYFRTIRPVPYTGRTPHIHLIVKKGENRLLTTQLYDRAEKESNEKDFLFKRIEGATARETLLMDFHAVENSKIGEFAVERDIIVGLTPEDPEH